MNPDEKYRLTACKEISLLSEDKNKRIYIVKDEVSEMLYVKKIFLGTDNFDLYNRLVSLRHKNLAAIHDVIKGDNEIYVIEDYVNGQTLRVLMENKGVLQETEVTGYILQVCDTLEYLHKQNPPIIHRDIKPENIICGVDDTIKLVDFDIAREFKETAKRDTVFMGTKEYAAPEQYGYRQTDCRTDIFSVGVLIHELVTGRLPENNITYNGALRRVIDKCIQIDPDKRFQSVSALKKALACVRFSRLRKITILVSAAVVLSCSMIVCFLIMPRFTSNPDRYNTPSDISPTNAEPAFTESQTKPSDTEPAIEKPAIPAPTSTEPTTAEPINTETTTTETATAEHIDIETVTPEPTQTEQATPDPVIPEPSNDLRSYFEDIESRNKKPLILLENEAINKIVRSITGSRYDDVASAFHEYCDFFGYSAHYNADNGSVSIPAYNTSGGYVHDMLLFEMEGDVLNIAYYDYDLETTYYFTTNEDNGRLSDKVFGWITANALLYENPVVFNHASADGKDITGDYYIGNMKKIEIFESGDEMKFSYTDIINGREAQPIIIETIYKLDDSHYWIKNVTFGNKNRLIFNFSENHLTLFTGLYDEMIFLEGIYEKE